VSSTVGTEDGLDHLENPSKTPQHEAVPHPFRIREIAQQSGLSEATVDRVLNGRPGVRASTVEEVRQAVEDLTRQRGQLRLAGRTFFVDVVVDSPPVFSAAVRAALEAELPGLRPAVVRARFHFSHSSSVPELVATLEAIGRRGSHAVVLKAPDVPEVVAAVGTLEGRRIPVVTLVTDLPASRRAAYVGLDNRAAGATAAYLVDRWLGAASGTVLVTRGVGAFRGEDEREMGFRSTLRQLDPTRRLVEVVHTGGDDVGQQRRVGSTLREHPDVAAVYSMYSFASNRSTIDAFAAAGRMPTVFIAHDLDADNRALLAEGHLSAVLHHDLRQDLRNACQAVLQAHGALPGTPRSAYSAVQVVTPWNVP
jgi:LacI family transcriptional regulator